MGIFRRKAKDDAGSDASLDTDDGVDETSDVETPDDANADAEGGGVDDEAPEVDASVDDDADDAHAAETVDRLPRPHPIERSDGPFDKAEVDSLEEHLDFGALAIVPLEGMELRLDVDEESQQITGLTAVREDSACQLQAFAAPKSSGIWDGIRDDIADGLIAGGGTAEEKLGPLGIELRVRMPGRGQDGRTTYSPARFIGVDGPRWFLRAVLSGSAAVDEEAAEQLLDYVRHTVVVRGGEARAPRELLPLKMPDAVVAAGEEAVAVETQSQSEDSSAGAPVSAEDLKPFERGPEITEVR
ncbi:DUF3710 domain-containing protein [Leekyejoonella antrihumi]|uniref:DUF3710 domain-containing protein n=1 Tax=Leekyejoonella antrihumi TaxID=1660198 RepID=A0A563E333_9MICO|nr:DUF3710 domain-containing protein [Leekyejoonella antrihumi]TWP36936.1 DUF3710 domain-containing protein [Leekyejoonella antrihumi]